jgi:hypothetical protein
MSFAEKLLVTYLNLLIFGGFTVNACTVRAKIDRISGVSTAIEHYQRGDD